MEKQAAKPDRKPKAAVEAPDEGNHRFSAKGLVKLRQRLGLSTQAFGMALGARAQTIYNWEAEKAKPRKSQLAGLAAMRAMGKREVKKILESQETPEA